MDTYYHINIVETLAYSRYVPMLAQEIKIHPNIKPESSQLFGVDIPGAKRYLVKLTLPIPDSQQNIFRSNLRVRRSFISMRIQ